jgi:hypothetical protein
VPVTLTGLILLLFSVTGVAMWVLRRRQRRLRMARRAQALPGAAE